MELWDLFDTDRRPLGKTHARGTPVNPGEYHIVVSIWTVDSKGNILLTLRAPSKESYPDRWENTGGSALAGETSRQAAIRELMEETGIAAIEDELILLGAQTARDSFVDHYLLRRDVDLRDVRLQPGETADAKWVELEELDAMIADLSLAKPIGEQFNEIRATFLLFLEEK
ncbi:MAG: NUDIX domain-containing protein [Clostridiales bacterium]|nr:NUDIX domain-containing protein [Clostridiales bacterium]